LTAPQKKSSPSSRKRDKGAICWPEGENIECMSSQRRKERLDMMTKDDASTT